MTRRPHPSVLEHLQIGGLRPELVELFRDRHRKRQPCACSMCRTASTEEARRPAGATGEGEEGTEHPPELLTPDQPRVRREEGRENLS
jgi:hypothetical protein